MFKELQELKRKKNESNIVTESSDLSSSDIHQDNFPNTLSLSNAQSESSKNPGENLSHESSLQENVSPSNLTPYFNNDCIGVNYGPVDFFDNISVPNVNKIKDDTPLLTYFNTENDAESNDQYIGQPKYFDNTSAKLDNLFTESNQSNYTLFPQDIRNKPTSSNSENNSNMNDDVLCQDDPEIRENEIAEYQRRASAMNDIIQDPNISHNVDDSVSSANDSRLIIDLDNTSSVEEKRDNNTTKQEISLSTDIARQEIQHSNVENLRQISDQLAQMIEPSCEFSSMGSITDLEKRNLELAANLERERMFSQQLQAANEEYRLHIHNLELRIKERDSSSELQAVQEISRLKGELQAHFQTIGLLVAEKTELSANLSQYEVNWKQKTAECEDLQGRLKASRSRVSDLERELSNIKAEKAKVENIGGQYNEHLEKLKEEYKIIKAQKDELIQDLLEARERLAQTLEENLSLQQQNKELNGKLSMADIKIQQLTVGGQISTDNQIEQLIKDKVALESEVTNLNQILKSIIKERDESTSQYQQYAQQLNGQISNLSEKLEQLQVENENLLTQEQSRIKHMGELERQLQILQDNQIFYTTQNANSDLKTELEKSKELCVEMQIEKSEAIDNYTKVSNENELLLKQIEAKNDSISQLENMVEQLRGNQPDSVKLLATMESDKVAAARAVQQNKDLKMQLDSMQEVFMKLDNDKVELTDRLNLQQQTNKDLMEKLQKTELHLQTLADAIEIKDQELVHLREASADFDRDTLHYKQLEDRLRHYEATDNSSNALQHELQDMKHTVIKLTNELNKMKNNVQIERPPELSESELGEAKKKIIELTKEINRLKSQKNVDLNIENKEVNDLITNDSNQNMLDKENAMKYLEEKVKRTMQEIANLTDEKQRLEHIVLQLQGETETIGEYVALYQHQRMVLKQKAQEKDQQLKQLAQDRELIKGKLDRLNQLIEKLVIEKGAIPKELILHQESVNNQVESLSEERTRINDKINSITFSGSARAENTSIQTAEEIISLLSEIKSSNLVQPNENYHHCPWCSGQLLTV
ncbi:golgin subfamily A member 2-like isoform X2 [Cylas formicarius]|uniref:golgin subfamily A member 2-like isoform X2 n=1 Tax=Cylas formicarius TaxID=197179 RepID=UPI0029588C0C|nr:golgin subfamily A member 2-like isoform X2 [Cylas formicarius]